MKQILLLLLLIVAAFSCDTNSQLTGKRERESLDSKSLQDLVKEKKLTGKDLKIIIRKKARVLEVHHGSEKLISYPCVLGGNPEGDKMQQGDSKTPEGTFGIRSMYAHKSWSYFIWIDYPNATSWERFNKRKKDGTISKSAKIGGEIGIHGVPEGMDDLIDNKQDWTLGCISLKTADITDLYLSISKATMIEILK